MNIYHIFLGPASPDGQSLLHIEITKPVQSYFPGMREVLYADRCNPKSLDDLRFYIGKWEDAVQKHGAVKE